MQNHKGYTLTDIMAILAALAVICLMGTFIYVAFHFISKFW